MMCAFAEIKKKAAVSLAKNKLEKLLEQTYLVSWLTLSPFFNFHIFLGDRTNVDFVGRKYKTCQKKFFFHFSLSSYSSISFKKRPSFRDKCTRIGTYGTYIRYLLYLPCLDNRGIVPSALRNRNYLLRFRFLFRFRVRK